jgi:hypothetical protein
MGLAGLVVVGCLALVLPAGAFAASEPAIEGVSVSYVGQHDAGLTAWINPKGLSVRGAVYQFQVVTNPDEFQPEIVCPEHPRRWDGCVGTQSPEELPIGSIPAGTEAREAQVGLLAAGVGLKPDTTYHYRVLAATAKVSEDTLEWEGPPAYSEEETFTTPTSTTAPVAIDSESVSHVTSTDATLEAKINPENVKSGALYQFQLVGNPDEYFSTFVCPPEWADSSLCLGLDTEVEGLPFGRTDLGTEGQTVSLDLAHAGRSGVTLKPGTTYHYRVIAATSVFTEDTTQWEGPTVEGSDQTFTTPGTGQPPNEVVTEPVEATPSGFKLKGKLNPDGLPTTYYFHYWQVKNCSEDPLDCGLSTVVVGPIIGDTQQEVPPVEVTGLTTGETYGYELVASNADGTARSTEETRFTVVPTNPPSEVVTEPAEATANGFRLKGKLNPGGLPTTYYFEYASDTCDEGCTPIKTAVVGPLTGNAQEEVPSVEVTGLNAGDTYWYRLVASNADGTEGGAVVMFTTLPEGPSGQAKQEPKSEPALLVTPLVVTSPPTKTTTKYKPLTKAQKLANALNACENRPKKRRATCKKQARKKYGKTSYKMGKQASKKK